MPDSSLTYEIMLDMYKQLGEHNHSNQVVVVFDANSDPPGKMYIFELNVALDLISSFGIVPAGGAYYVMELKDIHLVRPGVSV